MSSRSANDNGVTHAPRLWTKLTKPSDSSTRSASRTGMKLVPHVSAICLGNSFTSGGK